VWKKREIHTEFWYGNLKERSHLEDPHLDGRIILKWITLKQDGSVWIGFIWPVYSAGVRVRKALTIF
jgi:hypothetical protein